MLYNFVADSFHTKKLCSKLCILYHFVFRYRVWD